jgi:SAM-dependent methyltransferase
MTAVHRDPGDLVSAGYDQIADRYLAWSSDFSVRLDWLERLNAIVPAPADVLDLGCGAGIPAARWLVDHGYRVGGIDGSAEQIRRAKANVPEALFAIADMTNAIIAERSKDAVVATYSITHVPRNLQADLFKSIRSWLRPGGVLLASLGAGEVNDWRGEWLGVEMFFSHFGPETNLQMVKAAGLEIIDSEIVGEDEEGIEVSFLWVLARRTPGDEDDVSWITD